MAVESPDDVLDTLPPPATAPPGVSRDWHARGLAGAAVTPRIQPSATNQVPDDKKAPPTVSLILPALNEEHGLKATINEAHRVFREHGIAAEIIVVDDGSSDATADVARACGAHVVRHLYGRGYGYALRSGILSARSDTVVIADADGTYPLNRIPDLLAMHARGYDLVIGARDRRQLRDGLPKRIARRFFKWMCESATGMRIADVNSGMRVFRRSLVVPYLPMMCNGFSFTTSQTLCTLLLSRSVGYVPIEYRARIGTTKVRHFVDALRTAQYIVSMFVMFNPIKLFTMLALPPLAAGLLVLLTTIGCNAFGIPVCWWRGLTLSGMALSLSAILMGMGFVTFGVSRQRYPDPVSGEGGKGITNYELRIKENGTARGDVFCNL